MRQDGRFSGRGQLVFGRLGFDAWLAKVHAIGAALATKSTPRKAGRRYGLAPMAAGGKPRKMRRRNAA